MDTVGQLLRAYRAVEPRDDSVRKLDLLLDLERGEDPRILPFLLGVLGDGDEPESVRMSVLSRLRDAPVADSHHRSIGDAMRQVLLTEPVDGQLCLQAALALGTFTDVDGVVDALGVVLTNAAAPIELRYNAFTSLYVRGPTTESLALLRRVRADETLGRCARGLLAAWGLGSTDSTDSTGSTGSTEQGGTG